jgi:hypothetical protein
MKIELTTSGGIAYMPGLAAPVTIQTDALSDERRREIEKLVAAASFFTLPAESAPARRAGAADCRTHTITITDGARRHTIRVEEPIADAHVAELVSALRREGNAQRGLTPR